MKAALAATALVAAALATPAAHATGIAVRIDAPHFGVRIGAPGPVYFPPTAYVPAPTYLPPRVVYAPPPVIVAGPVVYPLPPPYVRAPVRRYWRHAHPHRFRAIVPVVGYVDRRY